MKKNNKILAGLLSIVLIAGNLALPVQAASNDYKISRIGNKAKTVYAGKDFELAVKKLGTAKVKDSQLKWTIKDTSIIGFDDDDRYDDEIELRAKKVGATTITCNNLATGGKITYHVTVKKGTSTISRIGEKTRNQTVGKEFELAVKKNGNFSDSKILWTIANTSIVAFDDDDRYDNEIELRAKKAGTTTVTANNLITGGKISYTIIVKADAAPNKISRIGNSTKTAELHDDFDLEVKKGTALKNSQLQWSIADTSILGFENGDNIGAEVELYAKKLGTTKVTCKNLATGGKIVYTVNVVPEYDD